MQTEYCSELVFAFAVSKNIWFKIPGVEVSFGKKKHFIKTCKRNKKKKSNKQLRPQYGIFCRLAGVAFVAPVVNYEWPSLSKKFVRKDYRRGLIKWCFRISKYAPGLLHWWISQKLFPSTTSVLESNQLYFNSNDIEVLKRTTGFPMLTKVINNLQRNLFSSCSTQKLKVCIRFSCFCLF